MVCQGGDTIDLGRGHVLEFINAPNLHWPDTMFTLDRGTGVMYTCDAFGMHYCSETVRAMYGCKSASAQCLPLTWWSEVLSETAKQVRCSDFPALAL